MKKLFLTLVIAFAGIFSANAQVWMGGSVNFNRLKVNEDANAAFTYGIAPEIGYTIAPKWDIALALGYQGTYEKDALDVKHYTNMISVNPYARYTVVELGKVGFFIDGGFAWNHGVARVKADGLDEKVKTNEYWFGLRPGIKFAASEKITFAAHIGSFGYDKIEDGASNFGLNVDNSAFTFGVWWNL
ncbi:MAG: outer membrane beta-barrel protein [Bacteroidales bacterium]|nr:outer membrane beta-barrel protein [Bacteroidales bacterium]